MSYPYVMFDNQLVDAKTYVPEKGDVVLYEVIRAANGSFLFSGDHLERLQCSAQLAGLQMPLSVSAILVQMNELLHANKVQNGNIRLEFYYRQGKAEHHAFFFIPHHYPSEAMYQTGIRTALFHAQRTNPNAKIKQIAFTDEANRIIAEKQVYEVILVHPDGYITEGSRSNFFVIKDGSVYTTPEADVLPGITRKYVLRICDELSIPLVEYRIPALQLAQFDAAFISGTSPKVLPVSQVDEFRFDPSNETLCRIMKRYDTIAGL